MKKIIVVKKGSKPRPADCPWLIDSDVPRS